MGLPGDPAVRAKPRPAAAPRPGTLAAAASAHILTLDEVRRLYALTGDRGALERANPSALRALPEGREDDSLDSLAAQLSRVPAMRNLLTRRGFTPRAYLVADAALGATVRAIKFPELRETAEAKGMAEPHATNLALYRAHAAELDSLFNELMKSSADDDRASVGGDTAARRRRMLDSLSRFVRTDSLVRLHIVAIDAPDAAIPALAQEIGCEVARLNWRHGTGPALTAMRRMRDSLWAGRPEVYKRTNERLLPYGMAAPLTDDACRWTRWPRASDSLMTAP
jgi:hypothetical protein